MSRVFSGALSLLVFCTILIAAPAQPVRSAAYARAAQKIAWIAENGRNPHPSPQSTVLTAEEWNAYLNEGGVRLPDSVSGIRVTSTPSVVHAEADVDFDRLTANRSRSNPLLALFTGKHHVTALAQASVSHGLGAVHIESVSFDGVEIPAVALEFFASKFLRPKYGNAIGMDATFRPGNHIDTAIVGYNAVTITQR